METKSRTARKDLREFQQEANNLLAWVNSKIPLGVTPVCDWSRSWINGLTLCHLVNAIRPGTVLLRDINQSEHKLRVRAALDGASNSLGVPELLLADELCEGTLKEELLITYIAFLRDVTEYTSSQSGKRNGHQKQTVYTKKDVPFPPSVHNNGLNTHASNTNNHGQGTDIAVDEEVYTTPPGIPYQFNSVLAFGSGLRWGQVGKPSEFMLQIRRDAVFSDLSVSIDCRPFDRIVRRSKNYNNPSYTRPHLQIKPVDWKRNLVRYTPTRPGDYTISVFYQGRHILNSPFSVKIEEVMNLDYGALIEEFTIHPNSSDSNIRRRDVSPQFASSNEAKRLSPDEKFLKQTVIGDNVIDSSNVNKNPSHSRCSYEKQESLEQSGNLPSSTAIDQTKSDFEWSHDSCHDSAFVDDDSLRSSSLSLSSSTELTESQQSHINNRNNAESISQFFIKSTKGPPNLDKGNLHAAPTSILATQLQSFKIYGRGLHTGEVGCVSKFNVHTPTYFVEGNVEGEGKMQGPLYVSITCPAMSMPVPFVRTKFSTDVLEHQVVYVPTEPGIYELIVKWGSQQICGSPFRLSVSECVKNPNRGNTAHFHDIERFETATAGVRKKRLPVYRDAEKFDFFLYYNASSVDPAQHQRKEVLAELLRTKSPKNAVYCIPVDIELTWNEREFLIEKAGFDNLPFVFVNNDYFGCYEKLIHLNTTNSLQRFMTEVLIKLRTKLKSV